MHHALVACVPLFDSDDKIVLAIGSRGIRLKTIKNVLRLNRFRRMPSAGHFTYDIDACTHVTRRVIVLNVFHKSVRTESIVCGKKFR